MKRARLVVLMLLAACKGEPNEGKLMPRLAPAPETGVPADLRIEVEVDGTAAAPIDAARLAARAPDFADEERRAWRLDALLAPALSGEAARVSASGAHDVAVELRAKTPEGLVGVLMVSRRGDVVATMVDAEKPFPSFHGQGGRLGRPPESLPRVSKVRKLRVTSR